jgi:predicted transcriptional regulator
MKDSYIPKPTESELEILQVLWRSGPSTVRFINDELNRRKQVGYTTTLKIMQIMMDKGMLQREEEGRKHIYSAVLREQETRNLLLGRFLESTFEGSAMKLVMQALGNHRASPEEISQLRELIDRIEKEQQ